MRVKHILIIMVFTMLFMIPQAQAIDVEPLSINYEINTYIETKIVVSYAFTQNVTSDAFSVGKSVWKVEIGPLCTSFTTSAADRFTWHLTITYGIVVAQTVTIATFSGEEAVDSVTLDVKTDMLILDFDITVTGQPKYPTAEEMLSGWEDVLKNELSESAAEIKRQNELSRQHDIMQWFVVFVVFAGWVVQTLYPHIKPPKREETT